MEWVDIANIVVLVGGVITWTSNYLLGKKRRSGWLLKIFGTACYTLGPMLAGIWTALIVNGITMITQVRAYKEWGKDE